MAQRSIEKIARCADWFTRHCALGASCGLAQNLSVADDQLSSRKARKGRNVTQRTSPLTARDGTEIRISGLV
jgi:hypothetical protein